MTFSQNAFYDGLIYAYPDGLATDFLTMLGFTINPKLTPLIEREGEQVGVSAERLDVLDADVLVFATEKPSEVADLFEVPTFPKLDAVFISPLSLPYTLEHLTPQLEAAVRGRAPRKVLGG